MNFGNIFDDPEVKKQILEESGVRPKEEDYEILEPETIQPGSPSLDNFSSIIDKAPKIPGGTAIKTIIQDASALVKDDQRAKEAEMNTALSNIFTQYNKEYGLDLKIDFSNFSRTLIACSDERSRRVLEIYVSQIFSTIRPLIILNLISKLSMALDIILSPEKLLNSNELSLTDTFVACDTILNYIQKLEELKDSIIVNNGDLELKKIAEDNGVEYQEEDEKLVRDFMELFKKDNLK